MLLDKRGQHKVAKNTYQQYQELVELDESGS